MATPGTARGGDSGLGLKSSGAAVDAYMHAERQCLGQAEYAVTNVEIAAGLMSNSYQYAAHGPIQRDRAL